MFVFNFSLSFKIVFCGMFVLQLPTTVALDEVRKKI